MSRQLHATIYLVLERGKTQAKPLLVRSASATAPRSLKSGQVACQLRVQVSASAFLSALPHVAPALHLKVPDEMLAMRTMTVEVEPCELSNDGAAKVLPYHCGDGADCRVDVPNDGRCGCDCPDCRAAEGDQ